MGVLHARASLEAELPADVLEDLGSEFRGLRERFLKRLDLGWGLAREHRMISFASFRESRANLEPKILESLLCDPQEVIPHFRKPPSILKPSISSSKLDRRLILPRQGF